MEKTRERAGGEVLAFDQSKRRTRPASGEAMTWRRGRHRGEVHRPLYSVPGFLAAVREALAARPDITRNAIVAEARRTTTESVIIGVSLVYRCAPEYVAQRKGTRR